MPLTAEAEQTIKRTTRIDLLESMRAPNLRDDGVMIFRRINLLFQKLSAGLLAAFLLQAATWGSSILGAQQAGTCPSPAAITQGFQGPLAYVRYLADDALSGRETGTPGARCAAEYIAGTFRQAGLKGAADDGSFFQTFQVQMGSRLGEENTLTVSDEGLEVRETWIPFGFSASGTMTGELIYGGPGVSQPGAEDDPYSALDLTGRIVVVEQADPHGSDLETLGGDPHFKASVAAGRGARAILILLPEGETLPDPALEQRPAVKIPAAALSGDAARLIRHAAESGLEATLSVNLEPRMVDVRNVAAVLPGADPALAREVVVVGAHYDHLGMGGEGSLAPDSRAVHNGADDNASGTAALLEVARRLANDPQPPARSVLFLAFTGEEKGLWGSGHYVKEPLFPLENTVAMINMDMVGRLRDNTLTVYGTGTAEEWDAELNRLNAQEGEPFVLNFIPEGFGPSDQSSFYGEGIPVLHFFTNTHAEYHRPEDDWELINAEGLEKVAIFVGSVTEDLAGTATDPALALSPVQGAGNPHGGAMPSDQDAPASPGYGAYMGTIPDMTPQDFGVRITGVREGSPAEQAGLQAGDVLVQLGDAEISDLYAYTYALRDHKPGDQVTVVVLREGERISFTAVLGRRE
jgi:aminopeptidase YwaD